MVKISIILIFSLLIIGSILLLRRNRAKSKSRSTTSPLPSSTPPMLERDTTIKERMEASIIHSYEQGLKKTHKNFIERVDSLLSFKKRIDSELYDKLEEILVTADVGVKTTILLLERLRERARKSELGDPEILKLYLKEEIKILLSRNTASLLSTFSKPFVIMVVGVNGSGKTTTIGKLAYFFVQRGKKVIVAAADTFRAAAIEQLSIWAERAGAEVVEKGEGADPSSVAFDSLEKAKKDGVDVVIVDTAGRLHTKVPLMEELKKIKRVINKCHQGAPHEILLILDATTGQNAISQARLFSKDIGLSGIVLTKLDGTAKGGVIVAISNEMEIPIKFVGVGEKIQDLRPFDPVLFTDALFGSK